MIFRLADPSQSLARADTFTDLLVERLLADPDGPAITLIEPGQPDRRRSRRQWYLDVDRSRYGHFRRLSPHHHRH